MQYRPCCLEQGLSKGDEMDSENPLSRTEELQKRYPVLKFFVYSHLPGNLQLVAQGFEALAYEMAGRATLHPAEVAAGLRKLLEAKDCAVRAALS